MIYNGDSIIIEPTDQCYTCEKRTDKNKPCPLLEALYLGAVYFDEYLDVENCSSYTKKINNLRVVKNNEESDDFS